MMVNLIFLRFFEFAIDSRNGKMRFSLETRELQMICSGVFELKFRV